MSAADTSFEELWARAAQITAVEAAATLRDAQQGRDDRGPNLGAALLLIALALILATGMVIGPRVLDHARHDCTTVSQAAANSC